MPVIGHETWRCQHGRNRERCFYCLGAEVERLRDALRRAAIDLDEAGSPFRAHAARRAVDAR